LSPPSRKDCILRCRQAQAGFQNGWLRRPLPPPPLLPPPVCVLAASLPHSPWGPHLSPPSRKDCILRCRQAQGTLLEWLAPPPAAAAAAAASAPGVCAGCQPAPQPMGAPPEPTVHERQRLQVHASSGRHPEWHCRRRCHCRRHRRRRRHRRCFRARSANLLSSHTSIQLAACSFRAPPTPCPAMPAPAPCHLTMLSSIVRCGQASRMAGTATRCRRHCRRRGRSRRLAHQPSTHSVGVLTLASTLAPLSAQDRQPDEVQTGLGWLRRRCDAAGVEAQPVCATASPRCLTCSQPASQPGRIGRIELAPPPRVPLGSEHTPTAAANAPVASPPARWVPAPRPWVVRSPPPEPTVQQRQHLEVQAGIHNGWRCRQRRRCPPPPLLPPVRPRWCACVLPACQPVHPISHRACQTHTVLAALTCSLLVLQAGSSWHADAAPPGSLFPRTSGAAHHQFCASLATPPRPSNHQAACSEADWASLSTHQAVNSSILGASLSTHQAVNSSILGACWLAGRQAGRQAELACPQTAALGRRGRRGCSQAPPHSQSCTQLPVPATPMCQCHRGCCPVCQEEGSI
jgi:hypothetical protein